MKSKALDIFVISASNIDPFSKLFHRYTQQWICELVIVNDPISPQTRRYTTLWNIVRFWIRQLQGNFQCILKLTISHNAFRVWWLVYLTFITNGASEKNRLTFDEVMNVWKLEACSLWTIRYSERKTLIKWKHHFDMEDPIWKIRLGNLRLSQKIIIKKVKVRIALYG